MTRTDELIAEAQATQLANYRPAPLVLVEGSGVWVLDPTHGTAALRKVEAGARQGELVVIEAGLNLSDKLLDAGGAPLREGERVRAREERR